MAGQIISFDNVSYSYPDMKKTALQDINLSVDEGEFLAVMGENGAGKTTFCKLINGIIPHHCSGRLQGVITVDGKRTDKTDVPNLALSVGMVLDDPDAQLFTSLVRHEAAFGPENLLLPAQEIEERVSKVLSAVGLCGFEDRLVSTLSGGEKQRLAIAASLAMSSKILVLDEPLCRLDPQGAQEVMSALKDLRTRYGITIIMATGDSNKMLEFADRVCVLNNGRVVMCDTAEKVFAKTELLNENGIQPPVQADIHSFFSLIENEPSFNESNKKETPAIEIKNLSYSYFSGSSCLNNINLSIADNDFTAIIGVNGCGKTTLLKNITGLLRPDAGDIYIRGKNTKDMTVSSISLQAGFVMQNPDNQLFTDSVFNEVAFALKNSGLPKIEIERRVEEALCFAGLKDPYAFPHALSRSERTRTVIACVLAMGCKIILLDEVNVGEDYKGSLDIMNIARELHSKGCTIVFVTHNISLVCEYAHRLIMMDRNGILKEWKKTI